jgi:hypothetical protein
MRRSVVGWSPVGRIERGLPIEQGRYLTATSKRLAHFAGYAE